MRRAPRVPLKLALARDFVIVAPGEFNTRRVDQLIQRLRSLKLNGVAVALSIFGGVIEREYTHLRAEKALAIELLDAPLDDPLRVKDAWPVAMPGGFNSEHHNPPW